MEKPTPLMRYTAVLLLFSFWLSGCAARLETVKLVDNKTVIPPKKVVLFFIDGCNRAVCMDMLHKGELPNIEKYFVKGGCTVEHAVTVVPSITYAVNTTFNTGLVPGHHGILGNKYFDRQREEFFDYDTINTYRNINYDFAADDIYEIMPDCYSVTIQTPIHRGAWRRIDNWATSGVCWFFGWYQSVDRWSAQRFELIGKTALKARRWPSVIFCYAPATDETGHLYGPYSKQYRDCLKNFDSKVIGRVCKLLERNGLLSSTYLVLMTDHGMANCPAKNTFILENYLKKRLLLKLATSGPGRQTWYSNRVRYFDRFNAVFVRNGGRCGLLYLKNGKNWAKRGNFEQIETIADDLVRQNGIGLVAYRENQTKPQKNSTKLTKNNVKKTTQKWAKNHTKPYKTDPKQQENQGIIIENSRGKALIKCKNRQYGKDSGYGNGNSNFNGCYDFGGALRAGNLNNNMYSYQVIDGADPLGYDSGLPNKKLLDGRYHSGRQWLKATATSKYPDLPVQISEVFDSVRAGDLMIFAAAGWDFNPGTIGGHGSVLAADMQVPMFFAGPGIKPGSTIYTARTADIAPTVIGMLEPDKLKGRIFDGENILGIKKGNDNKN